MRNSLMQMLAGLCDYAANIKIILLVLVMALNHRHRNRREHGGPVPHRFLSVHEDNYWLMVPTYIRQFRNFINAFFRGAEVKINLVCGPSLARNYIMHLALIGV